jgi:sugar/nucleoside kinase (ribokinase family)
VSKVIVIGHVNHDRVWTLAAPLVSGARIAYRDRRVRLGGGGFYTGSQLLRLGHQVSLVSNLSSDDYGNVAMATLQDTGFNTDNVSILPGETALTEILLDTAGERTILATGDKLRPAFVLTEAISGDAAYLNALVLHDALVASLEHIPLVVSQVPLRESTPRPADFMIGSKADFPEIEIQELWHRACGIAGARLRMLVLTDGLRPISFYEGKRVSQIAPFQTVDSTDTIGAGDTFAGSFLSGLMSDLDPQIAAERASEETADWLRVRI